ncbi:LacI family DNA-binding transcriptional regulator [Cellulomonas sp. S1-8]|uniref:LacI family DNA-binding transcriptional regulator n=1 Tax=Cellulomonas sp. S1-8 TaxID=2904790 RepID=UPI0022431724|nr:LacI family DNA-binding transcriptional regulator [Cellulomonas sp. S1-8]UZN04288.1 LacI family transcriptional regulator [Cellulomonas sp. S1-8]
MADRHGGRARSAPTIYDVAAAVGVAPSTVSRAFSRPGRVSVETSARIHEAAERLGYRANALARALPTGRTSMLAMVVSDVTNPFYFEIIRGAEAAANEQDYTLLVADVLEDAHVERTALERSLPFVEGLVLGTSRMSDSAVRVIARQRPTVVLNRVVTGIPSVVTDNAKGMRQAVEHLGSLGHRSIGYVAGPEASWADGTRWLAMREAAHDLEMHAHRVGPFPPTLAGGALAAEPVLASGVTGVVAYNDLVAIGLLRRLTQQGVRIPQDLSVVGFDDIFGAELCTPTLTTVAAPLTALGQYAVRMLLHEARARTPREVRPARLPARLVERESTAPPP